METNNLCKTTRCSCKWSQIPSPVLSCFQKADIMFSCGPTGGSWRSFWRSGSWSWASCSCCFFSAGSGVAWWPSCGLGNTIGDLSQCSFGRKISVTWWLALGVRPCSFAGASILPWSLWDFLGVLLQALGCCIALTDDRNFKIQGNEGCCLFPNCHMSSSKC